MNMGNVVTDLSMSLDGFIAGPDEDFTQLFKWYASGDTNFVFPDARWTVKVSPASAELLQDAIRMTGALVVGRRLFDLTSAWGGRHPLDVPVFVVTHTAPQEWHYEGAPFTFVTDGVESAIEKARKVAGERNVAIASASIVQQCLKLGLLDEINIDLVPFLLGKGVRMFEYLGIEPIELESTRVIAAPGVIHLGYRIVR
jgi:dihydrofolate reductase